MMWIQNFDSRILRGQIYNNRQILLESGRHHAGHPLDGGVVHALLHDLRFGADLVGAGHAQTARGCAPESAGRLSLDLAEQEKEYTVGVLSNTWRL